MIYILQPNLGGGVIDSKTGSVSNIHTLPTEDSIKIWWDDPDDIVWGKTVLVRKEGSSPESPDDGEILTESTVRDQYKYSSDSGPCYEDKGLLSEKTYYYALFTYSRKGLLTNDPDARFSTETLVPTYTVTFMNGGEVWDTVLVQKGQNAVCSKGNPSKASDENYDYSFVGWASTDGKETEEAGILNNITGPKTVYAAYSKVRNSFTVTFMNGSSVWDTVKVRRGATAVCSKGNPSKSQTQQYTYSFVGWANSDGQESAVSGILDNITTDKTVYAAFSKALRSYTVTFMNGAVVWDTVSVQYGGTASTSKGNPSKASDENYDYSFVGWASADGQESATSGILDNITNNKTVYAAYSKMNKPAFADTISKSWDEIIDDADNHRTSGYNVGDIKNVQFPDGWHAYELAGIDVDEKADESGKATFTFIAKIVDGNCKWLSGDNNKDGYPASYYKTYIEGTCLTHFPKNIQNAMKTVKKVCYSRWPENKNLSYTAKIWPPNYREMNYSGSKYETAGAQYTYYDSYGKRIRYNISGTATAGWLSSTVEGDSSSALKITPDGITENGGGEYSFSASALPCFCL